MRAVVTVLVRAAARVAVVMVAVYAAVKLRVIAVSVERRGRPPHLHLQGRPHHILVHREAAHADHRDA